MRKFGLLAMLTLAATLTFSAVVLADPSEEPNFTDPAAQGISTNATGFGTEEGKTIAKDGSEVDFTGQSYRMNTDATKNGGDNNTGYMSPTKDQLGADGAIKYDSTSNKVIHSAYSKTSDACASCHAVHTSVNQGALLQWEDPQTACWACHDGTVASTYDVVTGTHGPSNKLNSAGLFGLGDGTEAGLSNHGMSPKEAAFVTTAAAPGGAEKEDFGKDKDGKTITADNNGNWATEFTCIACHDPHGTLGSARILNPNVNGIATQKYTVMKNAGGEVLTTSDNKIYQAKEGYWLSGHGFDPAVTVGVTDVTTGFKVDNLNGRIIFDNAQPAGVVVKASYYPGLIVNMTVANKLEDSETVSYTKGINQFCGACHTDYNNEGKVPDGKGGFKTGGAYNFALGEYRTAYRHSVGFTRNTTTSTYGVLPQADSTHNMYPGLKFDISNLRNGAPAPTVDCLTCHYAHGTSDKFIEDSLVQQGQIDFFGGVGAVNKAGDPVIKTYDSSRTTALKRLPNMGVCQACHNKEGAAPVSTGPAIVAAQVDSADTLTQALADSTKTNIKLTKNITVNSMVNVTRPVIIEGNGFTLTLDNAATYTPGTSLGLALGSGTVVKNLTITTTKLNDNLVEVYGGNVFLENVTIKGSKQAGMLVGDNAKVTVKGKITLAGNTWGGIEVKNTANSNITFATGSSLSYTRSTVEAFKDAPVVWVDATGLASNNQVTDDADVLAEPITTATQVWWQTK